MNRKLLLTTVAAMTIGGAALALTIDEVVVDLQAQGYTNIEVREGAARIEVEASKGAGTDKVEMTFDKDTGDLLKREVYPGAGGDVDPGVEVDSDDDDDDGDGDDEGDDDDSDDDDSDDDDGGDDDDDDDGDD